MFRAARHNNRLQRTVRYAARRGTGALDSNGEGMGLSEVSGRRHGVR